MAEKSSIQWTDATWNVARGCTKVDEDCKYCYMYRDSMDSTRYNPLKVVRTKTVFNLPLRIKEPSKIFTSSLTDFFHEDIDSYRDEAWDIIRRCPQHTFQILTKRPERIKDHLPSDWGGGWNNVWLGTSVGSDKGIERIVSLQCVPSKIRFLSIEPLWGEVHILSILNGKVMQQRGDEFYIPNIHWVIIGGESGNDTGKYKYRPCQIEWIENIVDDCKKAGIKIFVKQMGTHLAKKMKLSDRHGGDINEFPQDLRIREFPI